VRYEKGVRRVIQKLNNKKTSLKETRNTGTQIIKFELPHSLRTQASYELFPTATYYENSKPPLMSTLFPVI
jgi:hypothetical protein